MTGVKMNNEVLSMASDTRAVAPGNDANGNKTVNNCAPGNGQPVAKLSDSPGKSMCDDKAYLAYLR
ncbi:hypothetical protein NO135_26520, partial [Clostridioides difficile]|nr:hypothetical protein [Clostridioides difficile]